MCRSLLLLPLLLAHTCVPVSWSLRCMHCETTGHCREDECALGQDLCRTTIVSTWEAGENLNVVQRGCAHPEKTNRTLSYRTGWKIITLMEVVCGTDLCNRPQTRFDPTLFQSRSRYLECVSCASSDLSCERSRSQTLQCRNPGELCLEVVTHQGPEDERHIRGCGYLPGCPGPTGFHNNQSFHFLQCCNTTKCNGGPVVELQHLPPNDFQCYSCEGNSTHGCSAEESSLITCRGPMTQCLEATGSDELGAENYTLRGCATHSWCQGLHVAEGFGLTQHRVSCCSGKGCNHPTRDIQPRLGGSPRPTSTHLSLTITLLLTARLWGGTLLWT
ncbi:PREDICTED: urokinase plasminogen activator surface receptor [Elephantulus edwardii]|uniref:urokinase plasminogen activator surface receptor n=1 Tax=Elephantulus edwardii TaxID=28737 RepID=UPI0003F0B4D3|nr:PREDICTED: urokinase plasminogen activator surface receptor [Elephantulus edwardii]